MKRAAFLLSALFAFAPLCAEVPETTFTFANAELSDTGKNWDGEQGWVNAFAKKCKARTNGIGVAPPTTDTGRSGMTYTWEEGFEETIARITVTCMTGGKTAAGAKKIHTLGVRINDTLLTESFSFDGEVDTPREITFLLDAPTAVRSLTLTNETDQAGNTSLFEINTVSWLADFPKIEATFIAPEKSVLLATLSVSLVSVTGGSGTYPETFFTFNGETIRVESTEVVTFTAPATDGIYPLTLTVIDSNGTEAVFSQDIEITPFVPPTNLQLSDVTRTGFTLTWDQPLAAAVTSYTLFTFPNPSFRVIGPVSPAWEKTADGWVLATPIDLIEAATGLPISSLHCQPTQWSGELTRSYDAGESWTKCLNFAGNYLLGSAPKGSRTLLLKTPEAAPPTALTLTLNLGTLEKLTLDATGGSRIFTVTDLPPGNRFSLRVAANYLRDTGTTTSVQSDPLSLELLPIPTFERVAHSSRFKSLTFTWPKGDETLPGVCVIRGERRASYALEAGLYLSRICFTKKTAACDALASGKAVALSNTSGSPVALDGRYLLHATRPRSEAEIAEGKTDPLVYTWDFSVTDEEGTVTYPYTIPAGGECLFYAASAPPPELREGAIATTEKVLRYLTPDYTLSLQENGTVRNSLVPQENAVIRLWENSLTETEVTAITNETLTLDTFYAPWGNLMETVTLRQIPLTAASGSAQIFYSGLLTDIDTLSVVRAHCYLTDGYGRSPETVVELYRAPLFTVKTAKPGFIIRLQ